MRISNQGLLVLVQKPQSLRVLINGKEEDAFDADVAAYFASQRDGLPAPHGEHLQGGHTFRESDVAVRLIRLCILVRTRCIPRQRSALFPGLV